MLYKLEPKPKYTNCPRCRSTDTFISIYETGRYCNNCDQMYDASDEAQSREKLIDDDFHMRLSVY